MACKKHGKLEGKTSNFRAFLLFCSGVYWLMRCLLPIWTMEATDTFDLAANWP
jgi:hypothetical protein